MKYGEFKIKKGKKTKYFEIEKKDGVFVYKRGDVVRRIVGSELELEVLPLAPVNLPEKLSPYFMVNFEPLIMSGHSRKVIFLKVPAETGVFVNSKLIDIFGSPSKYILYGPPTEGYICKNLSSETVEKSKIKPEFGYFYMPLRIKNYTSQAFEVSRVLINSDYLDMYYRGSLAACEMIKLDIKDGLRVRYLNKSYFKDMKKVKARGMLLKKEEAIEMRWGP